MAQKPSIPKGTRDFNPLEMARRNYIFDTIKSVFHLYGYPQIETPAMENLSTLMGKYGDEGDKLLFKVLNSGDFMKGVDSETLAEGDCPKLAAKMCEKGLRYDLTVPFARFVVMHRGELTFPFKRYQIQPVWRADRPQKGRYREFYQCDADIIGSESLTSEIELVQMIDEVFARLGIRTAIKINNRKVLAAIAELIGAPDKIIDITVAIDKIDKIGIDAVKAELADRGLSQQAISTVEPIITLSGSNAERLCALERLLSDSEIGRKGVSELRTVLETVENLGIRAEVELDVSLARGLNYYTGTIIEVKALDVQIGSITGGGRYDNLTGVFGMPGVSGVGISFGADRIYDVLCALDLYPEVLNKGVTVMVANFGDDGLMANLGLINALRKAGISAELYPDAAKIKKQMAYANTRKVPYVAMIGESELADGTVTLKNMVTGEQSTVPSAEVVGLIR